jgi:FtsH-binding integral membrane protein
VKRLSILAFAGIIFHNVRQVVHAQARTWQSAGCLREGDVATIQCLVPLFENVVRALISIAAIGLFAMFVVGGFNLLMSGGNPKQMEQGKNTLTYAVIGVVVMVLAYLIIQIIARFTGVSGLNQFTIPGTP